ncbi:MAG: RluA family pseudouridine synthase [Clostridiales bacterium]|nr:RluA family pseudouridine synthase [Clostridiales bacterium]
MIKQLEVEEGGQRIDAYIASNLPDISRSYVAVLLSEGRITCDGTDKLKASYKLNPGDKITIDIPAPVETDTKPQDIPLDIVYEDDDLILINKPQGMVVHPACGHHEDTLVNALLHHCKGNLSDINGVIRPGIVHRIDKDTSGIMVAVKNNETHQALADMLARHEIVRQYRCIVHGIVGPEKGTIDAPIGRSGTDRRKMTVKEDGKESVTHFTVIGRYKEATDLSLLLETGRTHQIRAHMTYIGHPPVGDPVYSGRRPSYGLKGQALHSKSISFIHPRTGEKLFFEVDLPDYYKEVLNKLTPIEIK